MWIRAVTRIPSLMRWTGCVALLGLALACASTQGGGSVPAASGEPTAASDEIQALPAEEEIPIAEAEPSDGALDDSFEESEVEVPIDEPVKSEALLQESLEAYESAQVF